MYVCICNQISDKKIRKAVDEGATTFAELQEILGVANNCGQCAEYAKSLLNEYLMENWQEQALPTVIAEPSFA